MKINFRSFILKKLLFLAFILIQVTVSARYYSSEQGRFISRDPVGYVDGQSLYAGYFAQKFARDPSGLLLAAVDGTGSNAWLKKTGSTYNSSVLNFAMNYDGPKKYWAGPDSSIIGVVKEAKTIHKQVKDWICKKWCADRTQPIDLIGHSRGGYIVMEVARDLSKNGCCCDDGKVYTPQIRFMGLYDPADMAAGYGEAETVPENVKNAAVILAARKDEYGDGRRSRASFNRADGGAEDATKTNYYETEIFGTHSGIGGDPWGGDHPKGHTKVNDEYASKMSDTIIRRKATLAGVKFVKKAVKKP